MARIHHSSRRALRAVFLMDLRRVRRIVRLPPEDLAALLVMERTRRYELEDERLAKRIAAGKAGSPAAVSDEQLQQWLASFVRRRPREFARLNLEGLGLRLQREHPELGSYSPDWLRQRLGRLKEAMPPATAGDVARHTAGASS